MNINIFSDFDDTISVKDIGNSMFQRFGDYNKLWAEYLNGDFDIRELNRRLVASMPAELTFKEIAEFAITIELDSYFTKFLNFCKHNNYKFIIVSDGYDAYIKPSLENKNITNIPYYCNKLNKTAKSFEPQFFGAVDSCRCPTASCKRNVLLNNSADDDIVIYIGDGHTDFCCAEYSDIVFAKSRLAAYCNEKRIPHYPFKSFFDIYRILDNCQKNKKFRCRHQALTKRLVAFIEE